MLFPPSPRCQLVPLPGGQVAFVVDGRERLRWYPGLDTPRPFLFPIVGPSGHALTRMGHPGAPNHDHHRSVWFAHQQVLGIDFWSDRTDARIRQDQWLAYEDGEDEAIMGVRLRWIDGHDPAPLLQQDLVVAVAPAEEDELLVELQTTLTPRSETLELGQTNFGLLAVRVAKSISAVFGDGVLTGPGGERTESQLFGKAWPWVDYSGPVAPGLPEGITYFDHPDNGGFPNKWHVRDDGWMGVSVCRDGPLLLRRNRPKTFRYLLHAHRGGADSARAGRAADRFHARSPFVISKSTRPHHAYSIGRRPLA